MALREIRDAGFAAQDEQRLQRFNARVPECWSWKPAAVSPSDDPAALRRALHDWQAGRCAVCGFRAIRMVLDHDHETGLVRGLLCRSCNLIEPHDDGLFERYRERPPAKILHLELRYFDSRNGWAQPTSSRQLDNHPAYALAAKLGERLAKDDA
ncbi:endonuclease domain-containing protein [Streptomyces sp. NPDC020983]|uniref:endonuclease domain-containing protein n=1 Tax=Streptomyces sp. NPDC020983 TaxID=3365106 RepID=UPI0037882D8C